MSHIKYCVCGGIYDITDNIGEYVDIAESDKHKPYFYCSVCNNYEEIKSGTLINIISGVDQTIYIPKENINKIKNKKLNKSLLRTKNYICQNNNCPTHKEPKLKEAIIEYVSHDSYIVKYICTVCNTCWLNRN